MTALPLCTVVACPLPRSQHGCSFLLQLVRGKIAIWDFFNHWVLHFLICRPSPLPGVVGVVPSAGDGGNDSGLTYHQWQINGSLQKAGPQDPRSAQLWSSGRLPWWIKDFLQPWLVALNLTEETFSVSSSVAPSPLDLSWGRWRLVEGGDESGRALGFVTFFSVSLSQ